MVGVSRVSEFYDDGRVSLDAAGAECSARIGAALLRFGDAGAVVRGDVGVGDVGVALDTGQQRRKPRQIRLSGMLFYKR